VADRMICPPVGPLDGREAHAASPKNTERVADFLSDITEKPD